MSNDAHPPNSSPPSASESVRTWEEQGEEVRRLADLCLANLSARIKLGEFEKKENDEGFTIAPAAVDELRTISSIVKQWTAVTRKSGGDGSGDTDGASDAQLMNKTRGRR